MPALKDTSVNGLSPEHFANWMSLYAATGLCAMIAAFGAALSIGLEVVRAREWLEVRSFGSAALALPRLWWRWQKRYLTATPVILAILAYYAVSLSW